MADVRYVSSDVEIPAYLAVPEGDGPWPGVVVIMDALGLSADIRAQADRLSAAGYLAIAPDLYARGGLRRCVRATVRAARTGVGQAYDDIAGAREWLIARPDCTGRIAVIGFCMGGGFAVFCAPGDSYAASAVNYGFVPEDIADRLAGGGCPIVGSFGARDWTLPRHGDRLAEALDRTAIPHDVVTYPGVGHSFLNRLPGAGPLGPVLRVTGFGYDDDVAADAWRRILDFFETHLRG
jgi:carboxymethylenebutenolidase